MDKIVIEGLGAHYDGEHKFDITYFTMGELHTVKRIAGVRPAELVEAIGEADAGVVVALATVALQRNGVHVVERQLWDAHAGSIRLELDNDDEPAEEVDARPPDVSPTSSGTDSSTSSAPEANDPSPTGTPASDTGATSLPATSPS